MENEANTPAAESVQPQGDPGRVTAELAASLPYDELKARMRAEARTYEEPTTATQTPADDQGADADKGAVTPEDAGTEQGSEGTQAAPATTQGQPTTEEAVPQGKQPQSLEEALRVIDSLRGNLTTNINARDSAQKRLQELEAQAARQAQEAAQQRLQDQHRRFEELVSRLPADQQGAVRQEYVARLQQQAVTDFAREVQQRDVQVQQREFLAAKAELPALYRDIAGFVADQHGIPQQELTAIIDSKHIKDLIAAASTPQAVESATIALGQLLDYEATRRAGQLAAEKAARREAKAATAVRDVPAGVTTGGAQEDVVARINKYTPDEFAAYKKRLLKAAQQ